MRYESVRKDHTLFLWYICTFPRIHQYISTTFSSLSCIWLSTTFINIQIYVIPMRHNNCTIMWPHVMGWIYYFKQILHHYGAPETRLHIVFYNYNLLISVETNSWGNPDNKVHGPTMGPTLLDPWTLPLGNISCSRRAPCSLYSISDMYYNVSDYIPFQLISIGPLADQWSLSVGAS